MTIEDLIAKLAGVNSYILLTLFLAPPILALILGRGHRHRPVGLSPWRYLYTVVIYWVSLPGILSGLLTGYTLFFIRQNLLQVNVVTYFVPLISMIITLIIIRRQVSWDEIPGVERLLAFIALIALTFFIMLVILKMRVWVLFHGSIFLLAVIALVCYLLIKFIFNKMNGPGRSRPGRTSGRRRRSSVEKDLRDLKKQMKVD